MRGKNLFLNMHTITNITWIFNFTFSEKQLIHPKKFFAIEHAERKSNVRPVSSQLQTTNWFPSGLLTMQMKPFLSCKKKKKHFPPLCNRHTWWNETTRHPCVLSQYPSKVLSQHTPRESWVIPGKMSLWGFFYLFSHHRRAGGDSAVNVSIGVKVVQHMAILTGRCSKEQTSVECKSPALLLTQSLPLACCLRLT